jgi:hypothetical protein
LQYLKLFYDTVTNKMLELFGDLPELQHLELFGCNAIPVTDRGLKRIGRQTTTQA